jgi:hypothetical protein
VLKSAKNKQNPKPKIKQTNKKQTNKQQQQKQQQRDLYQLRDLRVPNNGAMKKKQENPLRQVHATTTLQQQHQQQRIDDMNGTQMANPNVH